MGREASEDSAVKSLEKEQRKQPLAVSKLHLTLEQNFEKETHLKDPISTSDLNPTQQPCSCSDRAWHSPQRS